MLRPGAGMAVLALVVLLVAGLSGCRGEGETTTSSGPVPTPQPGDAVQAPPREEVQAAGRPAPKAIRAAVAGRIRAYAEALGRGDWEEACAGLDRELRAQLDRSERGGCPAALAALGGSGAGIGKVRAVRLRGDQAVAFSRAGGSPVLVLLNRDGDRWALAVPRGLPAGP